MTSSRQQPHRQKLSPVQLMVLAGLVALTFGGVGVMIRDVLRLEQALGHTSHSLFSITQDLGQLQAQLLMAQLELRTLRDEAEPETKEVARHLAFARAVYGTLFTKVQDPAMQSRFSAEQQALYADLAEQFAEIDVLGTQLFEAEGSAERRALLRALDPRLVAIEPVVGALSFSQQQSEARTFEEGHAIAVESRRTLIVGSGLLLLLSGCLLLVLRRALNLEVRDAYERLQTETTQLQEAHEQLEQAYQEGARLGQESARRAAQLEIAAEVARAASGLLAHEELLRTVVEQIQRTFGYYHAQVFLLDETGAWAVLRAATGEAGRILLAQQHRLPVGSLTVIGQVTAKGHPVMVGDGDPLKSVNRLLPNVRSELAIPLQVGPRIIGALDVHSLEPDAFQLPDAAVLQILADQMAIAIENARLFEAEQRRAEEAETLRQATAIVAATLQQDEAIELILEQLARVVAYDRALVLLLRGGDLEVVGGRGWANPKSLLDLRFPLDADNPCTPVIEYRQPIALPGERALLVDLHDLAERPPVRSWLAVPLLLHDRVLGLLALDSHQVDHFTTDRVRLVTAFASQVAIAIENVRAFEQQRDTADKLRELDDLKMKFIANMSHELRTPLNAIIGFSEVILKGIDGPLNEMLRQDVTLIYESGQHLLGLINDILDISKIEAGKMKLLFEEVNLHRLFDGVLSTTLGLLQEKPVRVKKELPRDLPLVRADAMRVRQILLNLLSNAAKFTDAGEIRLSAILSDTEVLISVADTGTGIPPDKLDHLFEAFYQVDNSATRRTGGTGLGLAITRHFVDLHGGAIWAESVLGQGTTFHFTLPIDGPPEPPSTLGAAPARSEAPAAWAKELL